MKKSLKIYLSSTLSLFVMLGCSSGNPTTPNRGNLTSLAQNPQNVNEKKEIKKINLSGRILDSVTRKPIENANILVYVISNENIIKDLKEKPLKVPGSENSSSTSQGNGTTVPTPTPVSSPQVESVVTPTPTPFPDGNINPSPMQSSLNNPNFNSSGSINEEEEAIEEVQPDKAEETKKEEKETKTPNTDPNKMNKEISQDMPSPRKGNVSKNLQEKAAKDSQEKKNENSEDKTTNVEEETNQLSESDLLSILTNLKINDIEEFTTTTGNDGKFWLSKVPDLNMIITVNAKDYRAVSVFNTDNTKVEDILLSPIKPKEDGFLNVEGKILSATGNTVENAVVSSSYFINEPYVIPVNTDLGGDFHLENVVPGNRTFFASYKNSGGKIVSMGYTHFDIEENKKYTKEQVKDQKDALPVIKMKSVTDYLNFEGKVNLPDKETEFKSVNVYLVFKKKGQDMEEVFLTEIRQNDTSSKNFSFELPDLDESFYYHFEFIAANKKGSYIYHHETNIKKEDKKMEIEFIEPIVLGRADYIEKDGEKLPIFSWPALKKANFYRVTLDRVDSSDNIETIWEGITPFNTAIYPISAGDGKIKSGNTYYWSISAISEGKSNSNYDKLSFSKLDLESWNDLSRSPNMKFSLKELNDKKDIVEIKEIDLEEEDKEEKN